MGNVFLLCRVYYDEKSKKNGRIIETLCLGQAMGRGRIYHPHS